MGRWVLEGSSSGENDSLAAVDTSNTGAKQAAAPAVTPSWLYETPASPPPYVPLTSPQPPRSRARAGQHWRLILCRIMSKRTAVVDACTLLQHVPSWPQAASHWVNLRARGALDYRTCYACTLSEIVKVHKFNCQNLTFESGRLAAPVAWHACSGGAWTNAVRSAVVPAPYIHSCAGNAADELTPGRPPPLAAPTAYPSMPVPPATAAAFKRRRATLTAELFQR